MSKADDVEAASKGATEYGVGVHVPPPLLKLMNDKANLALYAFVGATCSFLCLVTVAVLVVVFASTNMDCNAKVNVWPSPSAEPVDMLPNTTCASYMPDSAVWPNAGYERLQHETKAAEYDIMKAQLMPIGFHQGLLVEAADAGARTELVVDGQSGDVDFPHGHFQTILTVGEHDPTTGYVPVGVPDGQGVFLKDDATIRLVYQAESYGYISGNPSWYNAVNDGAARFTGSHITYVDYDKAAFKAALDAGSSVAPTVKEAGELFDTVYNLEGNKVDGGANPHFGDTAADGTYVSNSKRTADEWTFHSFCSAHLEEAHQWGAGLGLEDDTFLTVEEWTSLDADKVDANGFVGLSAHAVNMATKELFAVGAFGMGGYEKIVEFNCGSTDHVCFAISGYNGNFGYSSVARKQAVTPTRADGTAWAWPQDIVPARVYIGVKGYEADGSSCGTACGYLARNGLAHGRVYGFAVDASTPDRDAWHKNNDRTMSATPVNGVFAPTAWKWDGVVHSFEHDQMWDFQEPPTAGPSGDWKFWTAAGRDTRGAKTEHNSPDPRGNSRYIQGSTAGYMGIYDLTGADSLSAKLAGLAAGALPDFIPAKYELIEGETAVNDRIVLGGKGQRADGNDQTMMYDGTDKSTFEDIDGLEWFAAADGDFIVIQEDGGNHFGERTFMYKLPPAGVKPTYYFLGMAGGKSNTRVLAGVSIPPNSFTRLTGNEFSGASDFSGTFTQTTLGGAARRAAEATVSINDKYLCFGLQAHTIGGGVVNYFGADRGGQMYAFKPALPM